MPRRHPHRLVFFAPILAAALTTLGGCQPAVTPVLVATELSDQAWPDTTESVDPDVVWQASHNVISAYLAMTDAITRDGGDNPHRMAPLITPSWLPTEQAAFAHYRASGLRTVGATVFDSLIIQSVSDSVDGVLHVDAIACVDSTEVWLLPDSAPDPPEGLMDWARGADDTVEVTDEVLEEWSTYVDTFAPQPGERQAIVFWLEGTTPTTLAIDGTINWEGAHACTTATNDEAE